MGVGVSQRSTLPEGSSAVREQLRLGLVVLAAATGAVGPLLTVLGQAPVTLAAPTRPAAFLTVVAVAAVTAAWLGRASRPSPMVSVPVLLLAGALATWFTAGRVQGAWCVLATAVAVLITRVLSPRTPSPTRTLLAVVGLALAGAAGWSWARSGPGPSAIAVLGLSVAIGAVVPRSRAATTVGDRCLEGGGNRLRSLGRWVRHAVRRGAAALRSDVVAMFRSARQPTRRDDAPPLLLEPRPGLTRATTVAGVLTGAVMFPLFLALVSDFSRTSIFTDYELHMKAAGTTRLVPFTTMTPHWLFQALTALVRPVTGLQAGAALVLAGSCGLSVVVLGRLAGRRLGTDDGPAPVVAAIVGTVAFWLDSPTAFLNAIGWLSPARPFAPFHAWGSPTDTLAFPLTLLLILAVVRFVDEEGPSWFRLTPARLALAAAAVATLLSKPNIPMVMVGVVPIAIMLRHGWKLNRLAAAALWLGVPTLTVLALQFRHMHVSRAIADYDPGGWGLTIDPFSFLDIWPAPQGGAWFWLSMPVVCVLGAWVLGRRFWSEPILKVAELTVLLSFVPMVILRETGMHAKDGNFMKAAFGASMVLVALTTVELGRELWVQHSPHATWSTGQRRRRVVASAVVGVLFLIGGATVYLATVAPQLAPGAIWPGA